MGQEVSTGIWNLNPAWPLDADQRRFGAYHLRNLKLAIQATFPAITEPVILTAAELNQFDGFNVANINAQRLDGQGGSFYRDASHLNAGVLDDDRVAESNVTQHESVLNLSSGQITCGVQTKVASFQVDATMAEDIIICNSAGVINVTLMGGMIGTGQSIGFIRRGAGALNFVAGAGQTINTPLGLTVLLQHGKAAATYIANNTWELSGNL